MTATFDFSQDCVLEINEDNRCIINSVKPETIFTFPQGIPAFESLKQYVFITNENIRPFMYMQALNASNLSFVCIDTFIICPDYQIQIPQRTVQLMELEKPEDTLILSFVTINKNVEEITANLMSPIVINVRNKIGYQTIPEQMTYPVRYNILNAIESRKSALKVG